MIGSSGSLTALGDETQMQGDRGLRATKSPNWNLERQDFPAAGRAVGWVTTIPDDCRLIKSLRPRLFDGERWVPGFEHHGSSKGVQYQSPQRSMLPATARAGAPRPRAGGFREAIRAMARPRHARATAAGPRRASWCRAARRS